MIELAPEVIRYATEYPEAYSEHKDGLGKVLVDDQDECLTNTGEFIQSGLGAERVIEVGQILSWQRGEKKARPSTDHQARELWLSEGFVVYKGIGVGLTDLAIANGILQLAKVRKVGVAIPDF